jgi:hypothetical protein
MNRPTSRRRSWSTASTSSAPAVEQALATLRFDDQRVLKGQHLGPDQGDVRTMMAAGGWSDYAAIEPYLAESTEGRIGEAIRG